MRQQDRTTVTEYGYISDQMFDKLTILIVLHTFTKKSSVGNLTGLTGSPLSTGG